AERGVRARTPRGGRRTTGRGPGRGIVQRLWACDQRGGQGQNGNKTPPGRRLTRPRSRRTPHGRISHPLGAEGMSDLDPNRGRFRLPDAPRAPRRGRSLLATVAVAALVSAAVTLGLHFLLVPSWIGWSTRGPSPSPGGRSQQRCQVSQKEW